MLKKFTIRSMAGIRRTGIAKHPNLPESWWIPCTIVLLTAITVLSLLPLDSLPPAPGNDKFQHFVSYALLALPAALRKPRGWILLCFCFIGYSWLIEVLQPLVNRYRDIHDLLANAGGVVCGVVIAGMADFLSAPGTRRTLNRRGP